LTASFLTMDKHQKTTSSSSSSSSSNRASGSNVVELDIREETNFPSIVSFPHGVPPNINEAKISAKRKATEKVSRTVVEVELDSLTFKGQDFGEYSHKKNLMNYAVGVYSAQEKKMKVYPCSQIFIMRPEVAEKKDIPEKVQLDSMARRESLTNEFGSKKKKRMIAAAKSNLISTDNISGATHIQSILTQNSSEMDSEILKTAEEVVNKMKRKNKRSSY
jgi:hypothetical protein